MNAAWNGTGEINSYSGSFDWHGLGECAGLRRGRCRHDRRLARQVRQPRSCRCRRATPTASRCCRWSGIRGCVGFRPSFSFKNNGWGDVRDASISVQFTGENPDDAQGASRTLHQVRSAASATAPTFSSTTCSPQAGVDTQKLASERFSCQSMDSINVCKSQVFNSVGFGEIADFVWGDQKLMTTAKGSAELQLGRRRRQRLPGDRAVQGRYLAGVDRGARASSPNAATGSAVHRKRCATRTSTCRSTSATMSVDLPMRGNKNLASYAARLKMPSEMSSFHQFQAVAKFADGSERRSKTVSLFYYRPKPSDFVSAARRRARLLSEAGRGGCDCDGCRANKSGS